VFESAVSSNRIEGVAVEQSRVKAVVLGKSLLRDRDEEEVRGYRDALKLIHEQGAKLTISEKTIFRLHRLSRANIGDAGKYKQKDSDIIEKLPDGRVRARFVKANLRFPIIPSARRGVVFLYGLTRDDSLSGSRPSPGSDSWSTVGLAPESSRQAYHCEWIELIERTAGSGYLVEVSF